MIRSIRMFAHTLPLALVALVACGGPSAATDAAPNASDDGLGTLQSVPVPGKNLTLSAGTPEADSLATDSVNADDGHVRATMSWTGSGTYATGACLLNQVMNNNGVTYPCSSDGECSAFATDYPNGSAHCRAPNNGANGTAKTCWVRPGPQSTFCVGTPGGTGQVTVPTTKTTSWFPAFGYYVASNTTDDWNGDELIQETTDKWTVWMLDGCYQGCGPTFPTPSDSSALRFESYTFWDYRAGTSVSEGTSVVN